MIEATCAWVRSAGVLIRCVDEVRLGNPCKDRFKALVRVAVLDGPVVVGTDGDHGVVALDGLIVGVDVYWHVVHDRAGLGGTDEAFLVHLLEAVDGGGLEVVSQAEGVADFMHDHVAEHGADEVLGDAIELLHFWFRFFCGRILFGGLIIILLLLLLLLALA